MATILCYGDSNTHGTDPATIGRYPAGVRWPGVLRRELGPGHEVIEEGLNGRTTVWDDPFAEGRNGRTYLVPCLLSHSPLDVVTLMLGTNDLKAIFRVTAPEIASGAAQLVDIVQRSGCGPDHGSPRVLLMAPPAIGPTTRHSELWGFGAAEEESRRLAALHRQVAEDAGCAYLDAGQVAPFSPLDGIHFDADGHALLGRAVALKVREMLGA